MLQNSVVVTRKMEDRRIVRVDLHNAAKKARQGTARQTKVVLRDGRFETIVVCSERGQTHR